MHKITFTRQLKQAVTRFKLSKRIFLYKEIGGWRCVHMRIDEYNDTQHLCLDETICDWFVNSSLSTCFYLHWSYWWFYYYARGFSLEEAPEFWLCVILSLDVFHVFFIIFLPAEVGSILNDAFSRYSYLDRRLAIELSLYYFMVFVLFYSYDEIICLLYANTFSRVFFSIFCVLFYC